MATRIEPFRDYSEHEVINLYALDTAGVSSATLRSWKAGAAGGVNDAGVAVSVKAGAELPGELPSTAALKTGANDALRNYLGASGQPHVGYNAYPIAEMSVEAATAAGLPALGLTLNQTLAYDENEENLLRYPVKKDELQCVLPGQVVPVLTRGLVLLNASAFNDNIDEGFGPDGVAGGGDDVDAVAGAAEYPDVGDLLAIGKDGFLKKAANGTLGVCIATAPGGKYLCKVSF